MSADGQRDCEVWGAAPDPRRSYSRPVRQPESGRSYWRRASAQSGKVGRSPQAESTYANKWTHSSLLSITIENVAGSQAIRLPPADLARASA